MRTKEFRHYKRLGGGIWKNGEYLIEGVLSEDGVATFTYWASLDAATIGTAHTLDEAIDDCAEHKRGRKVLKFVPVSEEEKTPEPGYEAGSGAEEPTMN